MKRQILWLLVLAMASPASAQYQAPTNNGNIVVQTCGTVPSNYPAVDATTPNRAPTVVDANGNVCTVISSASTTNVNVQQINGVTPLMGNGVTGTGSPRVTIASNNTTIPVTAAQGASGATPWPVTVSNGAYVTDYSGTGATVTTLALSSGTTVMTASTVDVQQIRCNNFSATNPVYITMTDTVGNIFTGEATAKLGFAIPAYGEDYPVPAGSHIKMVGIKMYAGTGSAVNCVIYGKQ